MKRAGKQSNEKSGVVEQCKESKEQVGRAMKRVKTDENFANYLLKTNAKKALQRLKVHVQGYSKV